MFKTGDKIFELLLQPFFNYSPPTKYVCDKQHISGNFKMAILLFKRVEQNSISLVELLPVSLWDLYAIWLRDIFM